MKKKLYVVPFFGMYPIVLNDTMLASSTGASGNGRNLTLDDQYSSQDFDDLFD